MKRKSSFRAGLGFLVVLVLIVVSFFRGPEEPWLIGSVFAVWAIWMIVAYLRTSTGKKNGKRAIPRPAYHDAIYTPDTDDLTVGQMLLRHVDCRISSYLKSAYPDVTWQWCEAFPEKLASEGGIGRIKLFGVTEFNYADVRIDRMARIECSLLNLGLKIL